MLFSIVEDVSVRGIFIKSRGAFDPVHALELLQAMADLSVYQDGVRVLHDMRDVTFDVSMEEVLRFVHARRSKMCMRRLSLVHDTELGFGMCRAMASLHDLKNRRTSAFRRIPEALDWLFACTQITDLPKQVSEQHETVFREATADDAPLRIFQGNTEARADFQARLNPE